MIMVVLYSLLYSVKLKDSEQADNHTGAILLSVYCSGGLPEVNRWLCRVCFGVQQEPLLGELGRCPGNTQLQHWVAHLLGPGVHDISHCNTTILDAV